MKSTGAVIDGARARGITPIYRTTYRQACIEGWAPAPTNDFQKAIFERDKSDKERGPTKPTRRPVPRGGQTVGAKQNFAAA